MMMVRITVYNYYCSFKRFAYSEIKYALCRTPKNDQANVGLAICKPYDGPHKNNIRQTGVCFTKFCLYRVYVMW